MAACIFVMADLEKSTKFTVSYLVVSCDKIFGKRFMKTKDTRAWVKAA